MANSNELFDQLGVPPYFWCLYSFWFLFRTMNLNLGEQAVLGKRGTLAENLIAREAALTHYSVYNMEGDGLTLLSPGQTTSGICTTGRRPGMAGRRETLLDKEHLRH